MNVIYPTFSRSWPLKPVGILLIGLVFYSCPVCSCPVCDAQEFNPYQKHVPPEFTTALIKDGTLRYTEMGDALDFRTEVVEVMVPQKRKSEKPVTVRVPQVIERNGKKITTFRTETRFEPVIETVMEKKLQTRRIPVKTTRMILTEVSLVRKQFTFRSVGGESLELDDAKAKLSKWSAAIILRDGQVLDPYFKKILDQKTVVLVEKKRVKRVKTVPANPK